MSDSDGYFTIRPFNLSNNSFQIHDLGDFNDPSNLHNYVKTVEFICSFDHYDLMTESKIIKFMKHNYTCVPILLKLIPFPKIINLYRDYNMLENYWSINFLHKFHAKSKERLYRNIIAGYDLTTELVLLTNQLNGEYNFTQLVFERRLNQLKDKLKMINLDEYYMDTNLLLYLASRTLYQDKTNTMTFKLYPKNTRLTFNQEHHYKNNHKNVFKNEDEQLIILIDNLQFIINLEYYRSNDNLLYNTCEQIVYHNSKLYCLPEFYQQLNNAPVNLLTKHDYNFDNLESFVWKGKSVKPSIGIKQTTHSVPINRCYNCKKIYDPQITLDRYIDMCLECGLFNYKKRTQMANLSKVTAFISGIRQKIGFRMALKLLRCGAQVIGTTRYPSITWYNYRLEPDFEEWKDRLVIYQCDFLNLPNVQEMIAYLKGRQVNIIINNACQTIRPSKNYLKKIHTMENLLMIEGSKCDEVDNMTLTTINTETTLAISKNHISIYPCWTNQQLIAAKDDLIKKHDIVYNQFHDIKDDDIRNQSSWMKDIGDIDPGEILEASAINQIVPTLIINGLRNYMAQTESNPSFIINVTALEGQFICKKTSTHAHTNMCKAAINMLIRTMHEEDDPDLHVYAIDPGFVSGINPQMDHYPLSDDDGAARILDPIIQYYSGSPLDKKCVKLRNFEPIKW